MVASLYAGEVSGTSTHYSLYPIPYSLDTSKLDPQVVFVTGTTLGINPDRTSKTNLPAGPAKYYSEYDWNQNVPQTNGGDPEVDFTLSNFWAAMIDGSDAPGGTPVIAKQFDGKTPVGDPCTWYTYYWKASFGIRTNAQWSDVAQVGGGMWVMKTEHNQVLATIYPSISFQSKVTNSSFWWAFGDAKVYDASVGVYPTTTPPDEAQNHGANGNWPWTASIPDPAAKNSALSAVDGTTNGNANGHFVLELSAYLTPGVVFTKDSNQNIDGVFYKVDMQAKFTVLFSILVTEPLTVPPTPPNLLDWIIDWVTKAASHPDSWEFWLLIGAIVVIMFLLFGRKKKPQTGGTTIVIQK
jgi:hypothetical protein